MYDREKGLFEAFVKNKLSRRELLKTTGKLGLSAAAKDDALLTAVVSYGSTAINHTPHPTCSSLISSGLPSRISNAPLPAPS